MQRRIRIGGLAAMGLVIPFVACSSPSPGCFVRGTLVTTPSGERAIESLRVGDEVLAYDLLEERVVVRRVTAVHETVGREVRRFVIDGVERCAATLDHPFWIADRRTWAPARDLGPGSRVLVRDGDGGSVRETVITSISAEERPAPDIAVYNISVESPQSNYFADGVLVHNKTPADTTCISVQATSERIAPTRFRITIVLPAAGNVSVRVDGAVVNASAKSAGEDVWEAEVSVALGKTAHVLVGGNSAEANRPCSFSREMDLLASVGDGGPGDAATDTGSDAPSD